MSSDHGPDGDSVADGDGDSVAHGGDGDTRGDGDTNGVGVGDGDDPVAAERLLRSLKRRGVDCIYSNLGTDHTPLLEAAARVHEAGDGDSIPEFVVCPHEFVAMSAAHGHAAVTGEPQAVLVHVDVGTQNLGAAMHNAHRAAVPVFVLAGLAPVTDSGHPGSRDHPVHYLQDVFDQPGIVREYCRWVTEYQPPVDPDADVARGLERSNAAHPGPVYLSATREALETPVTPTATPEARTVRASAGSAAAVADLAETVAAADAPLVVTGALGQPPGANGLETLVEFAETAGAGVVEHSPVSLSFPRTHELHAGFDPTEAFETADLVVLADVEVPWVPSEGGPSAETTVVQIDPDPTKSTYPRWSFDVDVTVAADPVRTLSTLASALDRTDGESGRATWGQFNDRLTTRRAESLAEGEGRLTPETVSAAVDEVVDESTVIVEGAVTSRGSVLDQIGLTEPGSYVARGGAGLGWAGGAAVGIKRARPEKRVISLMGDGSYLFSNPVAAAWVAAEYDAPTLTVVYNNRGWNAVRTATEAQHPEGAASASGVPQSRFETGLDLSAPAEAVGAHTRRVVDPENLHDALTEAIAAVDGGTPAVVDVAIE